MDASSWLIYSPSGRQRSFASWQSTHRKNKKKGGTWMTSHWLFSCRHYSRPLAWLRASLSESDNHQDTFCCWHIGTCGYSRKLKMHADTNELPCKQKALIIVEALFQMHPVPVSFITLNMWYPRRSVTTCLVSVFASCFIARRRCLTSWTYGSRRCIVFS